MTDPRALLQKRWWGSKAKCTELFIWMRYTSSNVWEWHCFGISKVPFEIPCKISYILIERYHLYSSNLVKTCLATISMNIIFPPNHINTHSYSIAYISVRYIQNKWHNKPTQTQSRLVHEYFHQCKQNIFMFMMTPMLLVVNDRNRNTYTICPINMEMVLLFLYINMNLLIVSFRRFLWSICRIHHGCSPPLR